MIRAKCFAVSLLAVLSAGCAAPVRESSAAESGSGELLVGARACLEALDMWDEAAHAAAEKFGPEAARTAPRPEPLSPEETTGLWLDLARFAVSDSGASAPTPTGWFEELYRCLPPPSQWEAVSAGLAVFPEESARSPLLAGLRCMAGALCGDRTTALAALEAAFPEDFGPRTENPDPRFAAMNRRIRLEWTTARAQLVRDLSDAAPDLSAWTEAVHDFVRAGEAPSEPGFLTDVALCLPPGELAALADEMIARPEQWLPGSGHELIRAPGLLSFVQKRLLEKTEDGVPPDLRPAFRFFMECVRGPGSVHASQEGLELLHRSFSWRLEAAKSDEDEAKWLAADLRCQIAWALHFGNAAEAERLRGLLHSFGGVEWSSANHVVDPDAIPEEDPSAPWRSALWRAVVLDCALAGDVGRADDAFARRLSAAAWATNEEAVAVARADYAWARAAALASFPEATDALLAYCETVRRGSSSETEWCLALGGDLLTWHDALQFVDDRDPSVRAAIERMLPFWRDWAWSDEFGEWMDPYFLPELAVILERVGRPAEAERIFWEFFRHYVQSPSEIGYVAPILAFYVRAGRPQDAIDLVEGCNLWSRSDWTCDAAGRRPYNESQAVWFGRPFILALRAVGRADEAERFAVAWSLDETSAPSPWPGIREPDPAKRVDGLLETMFAGEARRIAEAAGLPPPKPRSFRPYLGIDAVAPETVDAWREGLRAGFEEIAAAPPPPHSPVFPAARIPVGDGGPALASLDHRGDPIAESSGSSRLPKGVPDRFAPLWDRPVPRCLDTPPRDGVFHSLSTLVWFGSWPSSSRP